MKYIIKNCPAYAKGITMFDCTYEYTTQIFCKEITNCPLKQIVEKCKKIDCDILVNTSINGKVRKNRCGAMDGMPLCCELIGKKDILSLLEIEEVDE